MSKLVSDDSTESNLVSIEALTPVEPNNDSTWDEPDTNAGLPITLSNNIEPDTTWPPLPTITVPVVAESKVISAVFSNTWILAGKIW